MILDVHRQAPPARRDRAQVDERLRGLLRLLVLHPEAFAREISDGWNDHSLFEAAGLHGIEGLFLYAVKQHGCMIPVDVLRDVEQQLTFERLAQSRLVAALVDGWNALEKAGIHTAALKGPVLGSRLYPANVFRPSSDIDLLVAPQDLDRAAETLRSIGYAADESASEQYYRESHHHIHVRREHSPTIELHFRLISAFGVRVPADGFLRRSVAIPSGTYAGWTVLSPEDEFLYLAIHAANHRFRRLAWLYELMQAAQKWAPLDWNVIEERARELHVEPAFRFAMVYLRRHGGTELPLPWLEKGLASRRFRRAERLAHRAARMRRRSPELVVAKLAFSATLCDAWPERKSFLSEQLGRIARRQGFRFFRPLVPARWAG